MSAVSGMIGLVGGLSTHQRTHDGKVVLYDRATGHRSERWPVDAREMMASGHYTADPPRGNAPETDTASAATVFAAPTSPDAPPTVSTVPTVSTPDPVPHVTAAMQHGGMTPIGAPLVVDTRGTAGPAMPMTLPTPGQRTSRGKR